MDPRFCWKIAMAPFSFVQGERGRGRGRRERNEELSRPAANSREIPWQSSVCTRSERVSNEIDSDAVWRRCPLTRSPPSSLPLEKLVATRIDLFAKIFRDRLRSRESPLRRDRVNNFDGKIFREICSRMEIYARLTIDLVSFSVPASRPHCVPGIERRTLFSKPAGISG